MNRRSVRLCAATTLLALLGYVPIAMPGGGETALCVGEDGHFGLKLTQTGSCREFSGAFPSIRGQSCSGNAFASTRNHCGPCVDIPVSFHVSDKPSVPSKITCPKELSRDTVNSNGTVSPVSTVAVGHILPIPPHRVSPTLDSIRSVVLLI